MDFLTKEIFKLGSFSVLLWYLIAAVVVLVLLVIIIVACCKSSANKKAKAKEHKEASAKPSQPASDAQQPAEQSVASESQTDSLNNSQPASTQQTTIEEVSYEEDDADEDDEDDEDEDISDEKGTPARPKTKMYHISFRRDDNRWQVKLGKGSRALKLFNTQEEAIAYAKELAKNQDGHIVIHKLDGTIRKQRY